MYFFNIAKKLSKKSDYKSYKLGSVIVKNNRIVGMGFNKDRTHPKSNSWDHYIHAELSAILNAGEECQGSDIYVYRENRIGEISPSKPCVNCKKLIVAAGIKNVYFTVKHGYEKEKV